MSSSARPHDTARPASALSNVSPLARTVSLLLCALLIGALSLAPSAVAAPRALSWPSVALSLVTNSVSQLVYVTHANDGSGRLFIVERAGLIRIWQNSALSTFLDITDRVESGFVEQGLLSVAFPPAYNTRQHFYVYYTSKPFGDLVIARFGLTSADVANPASEQIVLSIEHRANTNHNGGQLQFGPRDGLLYFATGDGGGGGDAPNNAQNPASLLGKLLRIDVETGNPATYTIPPGNPFVSTPGYRGEIWALGLRNPWRFAFDREIADLFIGDVGQGQREEIDFQAAASGGGQNYGWSCYEGTLVYRADRCNGAISYTMPIYEYGRAGPPAQRAVAGGYVYRSVRYFSMRGIYFYADTYTQQISGLQFDGIVWQSQPLLNSGLTVVSFGEDTEGNLYVVDFGGGIYQLTASDAPPTQRFLPIVSR